MNNIFNFHELLKNTLSFNKFGIDDLLFIEYNCPLEVEEVRIWSKYDYIIYVLSGEKTWITLNNSWSAKTGDALYIRKGANIIKQVFEDDFCMLGFFISDDIILKTFEEFNKEIDPSSINNDLNDDIVKLISIPNLDIFYQSTLSYFRNSKAPISSILELKAKELLMYIIASDRHPELLAYFRNVAEQNKTLLPKIMEANFCYNLGLEHFASLCNKSLSSFKREFKAHYHTTPGRWLLQKRLDYAAGLLVTSTKSISEIAYSSGFEDLSHFSKSFKKEYNKSPNLFRKEA